MILFFRPPAPYVLANSSLLIHFDGKSYRYAPAQLTFTMTGSDSDEGAGGERLFPLPNTLTSLVAHASRVPT
jgi:hypothetical protein